MLLNRAMSVSLDVCQALCGVAWIGALLQLTRTLGIMID